MTRIIAFLGKCNKWICAIFIAVMVLLIFTNTILRYFFHSGLVFAEELVRYLFVWGVFLATITVYYEHKHICVTTLTDKLPPHFKHLFSFLVNFLALFALGTLLEGSFMYYAETNNMGQVTHIPYRAAVGSIIISATCCILIVCADMINDLREFLRHKK